MNYEAYGLSTKSADSGRRWGVDYSVQWRLRHESSAVRALVRITRGPGFDPQWRCLNFFHFSILMSVLYLDRWKENGLFDVFVTVRISLHQLITATYSLLSFFPPYSHTFFLSSFPSFVSSFPILQWLSLVNSCFHTSLTLTLTISITKHMTPSKSSRK